ncbi:MAG: hypothetical protein ACKO0M_11570 [Cyanobium sp.]
MSANALELRRLLLAWWEQHGRHAIPWKLRPDGSRPAEGEPIDPYGVVVAEVMGAARQHSTRVSPASPRWTEAVPTPCADCVSGGCGRLGVAPVGCPLAAIRAILRAEVFR